MMTRVTLEFGLIRLVVTSSINYFRYVYARIASLKAMADQVITKFQEDLKHLEMFLNREKVPFPLKKTVIEYWKYQWKRTGGWSVCVFYKATLVYICGLSSSLYFIPH